MGFTWRSDSCVSVHAPTKEAPESDKHYIHRTLEKAMAMAKKGNAVIM